MNFKLVLVLLIVIASQGFGVLAQNELFVTAPNGLICRSEPYLEADRVGKIPYGSIVEVLRKTNNEHYVIDNGEKVNGSWVKIRVSYTCYLYSLLDDEKFYNQGTWAECFVFDGYLDSLNKATVNLEEIDENQFNQLQPSNPSSFDKPEKITDLDSIKVAFGNTATWLTDYEGRALVLNSFTLENGQNIQINQRSNEYVVVAYFPTEEVLLLEGGHSSDFSISLKTGEVIETVGNPDYILSSPNKKNRLNGFFPGQECSGHFFQKIEGDNLIYLVDFGWGSKYGNDVCNFKTFHWIDDDNFLYSYLAYSSNSKTSEMKYFKGELVQLR